MRLYVAAAAIVFGTGTALPTGDVATLKFTIKYSCDQCLPSTGYLLVGSNPEFIVVNRGPEKYGRLLITPQNGCEAVLTIDRGTWFSTDRLVWPVRVKVGDLISLQQGTAPQIMNMDLLVEGIGPCAPK